MVAMTQFIPDDPHEKDAVEAILSAHPELETFIAEVSAEAHRRFPMVRIELDTVAYDDWDPPLRLLVRASQPIETYRPAILDFTEWVSGRPDYHRDLVLVLPMWDGNRAEVA